MATLNPSSSKSTDLRLTCKDGKKGVSLENSVCKVSQPEPKSVQALLGLSPIQKLVLTGP